MQRGGPKLHGRSATPFSYQLKCLRPGPKRANQVGGPASIRTLAARISSMQGSALARYLLKHGIVGGLGFIPSVKGQCRTARSVRVRPDPRIFVGESPGLNRGATWILQARPDY